MKKIVIYLLVFLLLSGCQKKVDENKAYYDSLVKELEDRIEFDDIDLPFSIEMVIEKLIDTELSYHTIIDSPEISINDIIVLTVHNIKTNEVYPSSGIFDEKYNLIPDSKPKGIILTGYIPLNENIDNIILKTYISYKIDNVVYKKYLKQEYSINSLN